MIFSSNSFTVSYIETLLPCLTNFVSIAELFSLFLLFQFNYFLYENLPLSYLHLYFSLYFPPIFTSNVFFVHHPSILIHLLLIYHLLDQYNLIQLKPNLGTTSRDEQVDSLSFDSSFGCELN